VVIIMMIIMWCGLQDAVCWKLNQVPPLASSSFRAPDLLVVLTEYRVMVVDLASGEVRAWHRRMMEGLDGERGG
jgi:hypothetical protein